MFESIKKYVHSYMAQQGKFEIELEKIIYLDASYGKVDGCVCLFFGCDGDYPRVVAKGARTTEGKGIYAVEFDNLLKMEKAGLNSRRRTTPEPLGLWHEEGTLVTLQSALPGPLLKNIPGDVHFSAKRVHQSIAAVTAWWQTFQETFGVKWISLSEDAYFSNVLLSVMLFLKRFLLDGREKRFLTHRYLKQNALIGETLPFMMRHGDFCTANTVLQPDGIGVIDWEYPLKHQLPLFDLFFFFSTLRFPYSGYRGESSHFRSFKAVFWGNAYINDAIRRSIRDMCSIFRIPEGVVPDLFLLTLIQIANMKYDALMKAMGIHGDLHMEGSLPENRQEFRWENIQGMKKDVPFSFDKHGICENVRFLIRNGFPNLT
jgi:hypothetical protein